MASTNSIYTKEQLGNWLLTGDENIALTNWANLDTAGWAQRSIGYCVQNNPTSVYQNIRATFGNDYPNIQDGLEYNPDQQDSMSDFLFQQYQAFGSDDDRIAFIKSLLSETPYNPDIDNWTVPTN